MIVRATEVWPRTKLELENEQVGLAAQVVENWNPPEAMCAGGCFICFRRGYSGRGERGEPAWCAAVRMRGRRVVEGVLVTGRAGAPYAPGLLALREAPALRGDPSTAHALPNHCAGPGASRVWRAPASQADEGIPQERAKVDSMRRSGTSHIRATNT